MATVLITGTSKGIGFTTALTLARAGHTVYATMCNLARAPQLGGLVAQNRNPGIRFEEIPHYERKRV